MGEDPPRMPPPRPVAGLPAPAPEAVASAWLAELLAAAPLAAAPALASDEFAARAPGVAEAVVAGVSGEVAFGGPDGPGELLARLAAPLPPGGPAAMAAAGEALRRAVAGTAAVALAAAPDAAGPFHDRLAWAVAALVRAALAEPELTDTRPRWVALVEIEDAERVAAAGGGGALAAAGRALRAALPAGARCADEGPGRWRVTGVGAGVGRGAAATADPHAAAAAGAGAAAGGHAAAGHAAALADAVAAVEGPHGVLLRATAGAGATAGEAEERLLAARAAGVRALE
jgi:hypothetical protein